MNLVSYAQNAEDIVLNRALRGVVKGFYIDVGAQHPVADSVTKLFYEHGWHGINIDPVPQWFELLQKDRPHDINLRVAAGAVAGRQKFFAIADTGLSTRDPILVRQHAQAGYAANEMDIEIRTLDSICEEYGVRTVHFLKIDVEGAEADVIRGFSFKQVRPWIILVEAVAPVALREGNDTLLPIETYQEWEDMLLVNGYEHVYSDGLNRFYVAEEHAELGQLLKIPANPLDAFVRYEELQKHHRIIDLEDRVRQLTDATQRAELQQRMLEFKQLADTAIDRLNRIGELERENARLTGSVSELERCASELQEVRQHAITLMEKNAQFLQKNEHLLEQNTHLLREIGEMRREMLRLQEQRDQYLDLVAQIRRSRSWRMTAPFRVLARSIRAKNSRRIERKEVLGRPGKSLPRRIVRGWLLACARFAEAHPAVHNKAHAIYRRIPGVRSHLSAFARNNLLEIQHESPAPIPKSSPPKSEGAVLHVSPEAAEVYRRITRIVGRRQPRE